MRQLAGGSQTDCGKKKRDVGAGQHTMLCDQHARTKTVEQQRQRHDRQQHRELRARKDRDTDRDEQEQVVPGPRRHGCVVHCEQRPGERWIRDGLGHQKRREGDPRHADRQHAHHIREARAAGDAPSQQSGGNAGGAHHERVQYVRVVQTVRDEPPCQERRQQQRIELVDVPDQLAVDVRQRRVELGDAQGQPLVEQLVGHHVPVGDLGRQHRQPSSEGQP